MPTKAKASASAAVKSRKTSAGASWESSAAAPTVEVPKTKGPSSIGQRNFSQVVKNQQPSSQNTTVNSDQLSGKLANERKLSSHAVGATEQPFSVRNQTGALPKDQQPVPPVKNQSGALPPHKDQPSPVRNQVTGASPKEPQPTPVRKQSAGASVAKDQPTPVKKQSGASVVAKEQQPTRVKKQTGVSQPTRQPGASVAKDQPTPPVKNQAASSGVSSSASSKDHVKGSGADLASTITGVPPPVTTTTTSVPERVQPQAMPVTPPPPEATAPSPLPTTINHTTTTTLTPTPIPEAPQEKPVTATSNQAPPPKPREKPPPSALSARPLSASKAAARKSMSAFIQTDPIPEAVPLSKISPPNGLGVDDSKDLALKFAVTYCVQCLKAYSEYASGSDKSSVNVTSMIEAVQKLIATGGGRSEVVAQKEKPPVESSRSKKKNRSGGEEREKRAKVPEGNSSSSTKLKLAKGKFSQEALSSEKESFGNKKGTSDETEKPTAQQADRVDDLPSTESKSTQSPPPSSSSSISSSSKTAPPVPPSSLGSSSTSSLSSSSQQTATRITSNKHSPLTSSSSSLDATARPFHSSSEKLLPEDNSPMYPDSSSVPFPPFIPPPQEYYPMVPPPPRFMMFPPHPMWTPAGPYMTAMPFFPGHGPPMVSPPAPMMYQPAFVPTEVDELGPNGGEAPVFITQEIGLKDKSTLACPPQQQYPRKYNISPSHKKNAVDSEPLLEKTGDIRKENDSQEAETAATQVQGCEEEEGEELNPSPSPVMSSPEPPPAMRAESAQDSQDSRHLADDEEEEEEEDCLEESERPEQEKDASEEVGPQVVEPEAIEPQVVEPEAIEPEVEPDEEGEERDGEEGYEDGGGEREEWGEGEGQEQEEEEEGEGGGYYDEPVPVGEEERQDMFSYSATASSNEGGYPTGFPCRPKTYYHQHQQQLPTYPQQQSSASSYVPNGRGYNNNNGGSNNYQRRSYNNRHYQRSNFRGHRNYGNKPRFRSHDNLNPVYYPPKNHQQQQKQDHYHDYDPYNDYGGGGGGHGNQFHTTRSFSHGNSYNRGGDGGSGMPEGSPPPPVANADAAAATGMRSSSSRNPPSSDRNHHFKRVADAPTRGINASKELEALCKPDVNDLDSFPPLQPKFFTDVFGSADYICLGEEGRGGGLVAGIESVGGGSGGDRDMPDSSSCSTYPIPCSSSFNNTDSCKGGFSVGGRECSLGIGTGQRGCHYSADTSSSSDCLGVDDGTTTTTTTTYAGFPGPHSPAKTATTTAQQVTMPQACTQEETKLPSESYYLYQYTLQETLLKRFSRHTS